MAADKVSVLTPETFETFVQAAETPVLVKFSRPNCPHCDNFQPAFDKASAEVSGVVFAAFTVAGDAGMQIAKRYGIRGVPALKLFRKNAIAETIPVVYEADAFKAKAMSLV